MKTKRVWAIAMLTCGSFACGGAQTPPEQTAVPAPTSPEELSFEADTVHPNDVDVPESAAGATPVATAALRALDARHPAIAQCYATLLRTSSEAVGRIAVDIAVGPEGHPTRVSGRTEGEGGIGNARVCVENALRGLQMRGVPANGVRIRRSYSFVNPAVELTVADPFTINPPRRGRPVAAAANSAEPSGPPEGATGPLTVAEVPTVVAMHTADLSNCYGTALRAARGAAGNGTMVLTVGADGAVSATTFASDVPALATMNECIATATHGWHFRASGTGASVHVPLVFAR